MITLVDDAGLWAGSAPVSIDPNWHRPVSGFNLSIRHPQRFGGRLRQGAGVGGPLPSLFLDRSRRRLSFVRIEQQLHLRVQIWPRRRVNARHVNPTILRALQNSTGHLRFVMAVPGLRALQRRSKVMKPGDGPATHALAGRRGKGVGGRQKLAARGERLDAKTGARSAPFSCGHDGEVCALCTAPRFAARSHAIMKARNRPRST